ncbi:MULTISPECIES: hypothetical protein [unclassified Nonomuraea]|uniref:hypothetical protein n=1 Tax=unclassified Nonomuraea TaxID=2593643 RepID=UPI0034021025
MRGCRKDTAEPGRLPTTVNEFNGDGEPIETEEPCGQRPQPGYRLAGVPDSPAA